MSEEQTADAIRKCERLAHIEKVLRIREGSDAGLGAGEYIHVAELTDGREVPFCAKAMDYIISEGMDVIMFEDEIYVDDEIRERVNIIDLGCMKNDNVLHHGGILPLDMFHEVTDEIIYDESICKDIILFHDRVDGRDVVTGGELVGADVTQLLGVIPANVSANSASMRKPYAGRCLTKAELPEKGAHGDIWFVKEGQTDYIYFAEPDIITEETGWLEYGRYPTLAERRRVRQERVKKILEENRKGALA